MMVLVQLTAEQPQARLLFQRGTIACEVIQTVTVKPGKMPQAAFELQPVDVGTDVAQTFICCTGADYKVEAFAALPAHAVTRQYLGHLQEKSFQELRVGSKQLPMENGECITLLIKIQEIPPC